MTSSPEWPNWEFRDGRKRAVLSPKDDEGSSPVPVRLNSESALKRSKSEGGATDRTSVEASTSKHKDERRHHSSKKRKGKSSSGWLCKESMIASRRASINSLPDTVPPWDTVENRAGTPLRAIENRKDENLPDPLSKLMLEREDSVRKKEGERRKESRLKDGERKREDRGREAAAAAGAAEMEASSKVEVKSTLTTPLPKRPERKQSLFDGRRKSEGGQKRSSEGAINTSRNTVAEAKDTVEERDRFADLMKERPKAVSVAIDPNWNTPSAMDFRRPKGSRRSDESEKGPTVLVRRESTSVVPPTPEISGREEGGDDAVVTPSVQRVSKSDFTPGSSGKRKSEKSIQRRLAFGERREDSRRAIELEETIGGSQVKPQPQLSWGKLALALYRKTTMGSEVSICSTLPGEFDEEITEREREKERMASIESLRSDKSGVKERGNPDVGRLISRVSLASTRPPSSSCSVVGDSMEEEEGEGGEGEGGFREMEIEEESQPSEFEIKDTVQEGAPKPMKFVKPGGLGLFRRPLVPVVRADGLDASPPLPPPSRQSSGGGGERRGRRGGQPAIYDDRMGKKLERVMAMRRSERTLVKHDSTSVSSIVLKVEEDRSTGWGVSLVAHSRGGYILQQAQHGRPAAAAAEGSSLRVALPLECLLGAIAISPTVL